MKNMGLNEVREKFLAFFESKEHLRMQSFPLVPRNDKSLLLINSGMAPLKPYFTGQEVPPNKRVTTCQKCIRTGDIENVGKTARHGTFFEMLGNFSFGDYFKEEIIPWSWEFCTEVMEIPKDKLYVSVYLEDDEAFDIWEKKVGIPKERIFRMGKADNFWEVGLGPCGPCSEIYFDRGEKYGCGSESCTVGCDCDRYMEFWNLVFTQFSKEEDGTYAKLAFPNIDTGMGLERMATMMQDVDSIFDVDTIRAVRENVCTLANVEYKSDAKKDISIRVITDHVRSVTFMTADGVLPSNEGRGYVLRRLLRRAIRHAKLLGINNKFVTDICQVVIDNSHEAYPELLEKKDYIFKVLSVEENRFFETLDTGMEMIKDLITKLKSENENVVSGKDAFKMYDTYGFPIDLMKEILEESEMTTDEKEFYEEMDAQRKRARAAREESNYMGAEETVYNQIDTALVSEFLGYDVFDADAKIIAIVASGELAGEAVAGQEVSIILDHTPFYAESGGQTGDNGKIVCGKTTINISDCIKVVGNKIAHIGIVACGSVKLGDTVTVSVDKAHRLSSARNHTATHLLQKALRAVLGNHVEQSGSYVSSERLRFDFTHFAAMTADELQKVEEQVNEKVLESLDVEICEKDIDDARKMGATALFGEKYGKTVRVVNVLGYSIELCGGTHLSNTAQVGSFKILSESGVAAGVRRIEALTGKQALTYYRELDEKINAVAVALKATPTTILQKANAMVEQSRTLSQEIEKLKSKAALGMLDEILENKTELNGLTVVTAVVASMEADALRNLGDMLKDKLQSGVVVLASDTDGKAQLVAMATDDVVKRGVHVGNAIKEAVELLGGKGGGRPNMAQAGGRDVSKMAEALDKAKEVLAKQI